MAILHIFDPNTTQYVNYNAYITAFSDGFKTDYDVIQAAGATDPLRLYKGVTREIVISFDVPSQNITEARENLLKLNTLANCLYGVSNQSTQTVVLQGGVLKVLYENIIIAQGKNYSSGVETAGLDVQVLSYSSKFDFDAGFFTNVGIDSELTEAELIQKAKEAGQASRPDEFKRIAETLRRKENYIYPKLIKIDLTLATLHEQRPGAKIINNKITLDPKARLYPYKVSDRVPSSCAGTPAPSPRAAGGASGSGRETPEQLAAAAAAATAAAGGGENARQSFERAQTEVDKTRTTVLGGSPQK
jgi:hypothetical protein